MFSDTMVAQDGNHSPKTEDLASISEVPVNATGMFRCCPLCCPQEPTTN